MLSNIFSKETKKTFHCEMNGKETTIDKTRVLTRINGLINLKLLENPQIDFESKTIFPSNKPPIKFFSKIHMPPDLKAVLGDLFTTVEDEDETEQSTHILSDEGINYFMGSQLVKFIPYLSKYEVIKFPETMFLVSANDTSIFKTQIRTCDNWGITYPSTGKKYMAKKILDTKIESQTFGNPSILWPGYDVAVSDCSAKNPKGTGYLFKTDKNFLPINLCSNESAVDYCNKNNCLVYYTDFMNEGKMRILSKHTENINKNLQNNYLFRSSNI